jgi:hypothetical protein
MAELNDINRHEAVPCPNCFQYQPYMYSRVGYIRYANWGCVGYPLVIFGPIALVVSGIAAALFQENWLLFLGTACAGFMACLVGYLTLRRLEWLASQHDPNTERLDERKRVARERAKTLEAFDEQQAQRARIAYNEREDLPAGDPTSPWAGLETHAKPKPPLVVEWWVAPSVLTNGGTFSIPLGEIGTVTVEIPELTESDTVLQLCSCPPSVFHFKVCVVAIHVHPDEMRLE